MARCQTNTTPRKANIMNKKLVINVEEFSKFLQDNPEFAKTVLDKNGDMVAGSPFEQFLLENPKKAEEIPGISIEEMTDEDKTALERIYGSLNLPTEDEVYEEALASRAHNTSCKVNRLAKEVRDEAKALVEKSDELMRAQMELNVLNEELAENKKMQYYALNVKDGALEYTGTDLLKAYAQLKAVFDIDNERPDPSLYSEEKLERLVHLIAPEPGLKKGERAKFTEEIRKVLKEKGWTPETVSKVYFERTRPEVKNETLNEYTKYYNSDQQL